MNSTLLKKCIKEMGGSDNDSLKKLCEVIINDEERKGHTNLAKQLSNIYKNSNSNITDRFVMQPLSKKEVVTSNNVFITHIPYEKLRHDMVLETSVEKRFLKIESEYMARNRLASFGLKPIKKILLYGMPGCGKTMGAERIAWSIGLPLIKVKLDTLISSYFGESAANLRTVFNEAHKQPAVLFLDECDFIAKRRNDSRDIGEVSRIVNTLLLLLEEYNAPGLLVAATNLDETLDPAIFRRFDEVFEIHQPGAEEIIKLLKMTLASMKKDRHLCWSSLAEQLVGTSAAMVVKIAQQAAKEVVLMGLDNIIRQDDIQKAVASAYKHPAK